MEFEYRHLKLLAKLRDFVMIEGMRRSSDLFHPYSPNRPVTPEEQEVTELLTEIYAVERDYVYKHPRRNVRKIDDF